MVKRMSLRARINSTIGVSILVVGLVVSWLSYRSAMVEMESQIDSQVNAVSVTFSRYVGEWLGSKGRMLASFPADAEPERYNDHLVQFKLAADVDNVFLAFPDGALVNANNLEMAADNADPRVWSWYINAAANPGRTVVENPSVASATGADVVSLGRAVLADGRLKAVLGIDVELASILEQLGKVELPGDGRMFLVSHGKTVFAHTDQSLLNQPLEAVLPALTPALLAQLLKNPHESAIVAAGDGQVQLFSSAIPDSHLSLVLMLDRERLVAPARAALLEQLLTIGLLLVAILAASGWVTHRLLQPLQTVSRSMADITSGTGDLSRRLPVTSADEVGQLAANFNTFMGQLHALVSRLRDKAGELDEIAVTAVSRATRSAAEQRAQRDQLGRVTDAMRDMSVATNEIARHAESVSVAVQDSAEGTARGRDRVVSTQQSIQGLSGKIDSAAEVVGHLNQHANDIDGILATIQGIAEQTNLLALNAAIEAARAGEQGRGFAVVADEVRVLSQRTHQCTEEIQSVISSLQSSADSAVAIMANSREFAADTVENADSAAVALNSINEAVQTISGMTVQIATTSEEQSHVAHEIQQALGSVEEIAQRSAEETVAMEQGAAVLRQHAKDLNDSVSMFKL